MPDHAVHTDGAIVEVVVGEDDEHGVLSLLALDEDSVATEQLEGLHGVVGEGEDGVVIGGGVGDDQAVGLLLFLEDGGGDLIVVVLLAARVTGMMLAPYRQRWRWQTWRHGDKAHRRRAGWNGEYSLAQVDLLLALGVVRLGRHDGGCVMGGLLKRCMDSRGVRGDKKRGGGPAVVMRWM